MINNDIKLKNIIFASYADLDKEELINLINEYENSNRENVRDRILLLKKIFIHKSKDFHIPRIPIFRRTYAPNSNFFRIRKDDGIWGDLAIQDFWEPPTGGGQGRLNVHGERLLYAAQSPVIALAEARAQSSTLSNCLLIVYRNKYDLSLTEIGFEGASNNSIYADVVEKVRLIEEFARRCFMESNSDNFTYEVTNLLSKKYFDYSVDGWCYASIAHPGGDNYCFRLEAKTKLDLMVGLRYGENNCLDGLYHFNGNEVKYEDDFSSDESPGVVKLQEIKKVLAIQAKISDIHPENSSTEPALIYKIVESFD